MKYDALIQQDVIEELQCQPSINALHVGVGVHCGSVTLVGHVSSHTEKWQVECVARAVPDVEDVVNELEIWPISSAYDCNADTLGPIDSLATNVTASILDADFDDAWRRRANAQARNTMN